MIVSHLVSNVTLFSLVILSCEFIVVLVRDSIYNDVAVVFAGCGADITAQSGYIATPGYPNAYPHSTECVWTIRVTPGNRVGISFQ